MSDAIRYPDAQRIQREVCAHWGVALADVVGPSRQRDVSDPRHIAMYLCRQLTDLSLSQIGGLFGDRCEAAVVAAERKIEGWVTAGGFRAREVAALKARLLGDVGG